MNRWFNFSKNILGYAGEFALFALKSAVLRGMPRSQPGAFMGGSYESKLNVAYFCLSPLLLTAALIFGVTAIFIALGSGVLGFVELVVNTLKPAPCHQAQPKVFSLPHPPESQAVMIAKLNHNRLPSQSVAASAAPLPEIDEDEVISCSESYNEYSSSAENSSEDLSLLSYFMRAFM